MDRRPTASLRSAAATGNTARTVFASMVGLLPVALVSGMMLLQVLGLWR